MIRQLEQEAETEAEAEERAQQQQPTVTSSNLLSTSSIGSDSVFARPSNTLTSINEDEVDGGRDNEAFDLDLDPEHATSIYRNGQEIVIQPRMLPDYGEIT